jgi:uncharacterized protein YbjT (DUF2867 family)
MIVLVVGATEATGRLLVAELLNRAHHVRAVVRDSAKLPNGASVIAPWDTGKTTMRLYLE